MQKHLLFVLFLAIVAAGCKDDTQVDQFSVDWFYQDIATITVEVAYEPNAIPFTSSTSLGYYPWDLTEENIEALFANRPSPLDVLVPADLAAMNQIPDQNKDSYTLQEIKDIADTYRIGTNTRTDGSVFLLYLDGYYNDGDGEVPGVLGLNIVGTTITAIFKPVVASTSPFSRVQTFVEQTTIIHELGHALGLVNNGVPTTSDHHDEPHGAHCTNTDCVMYYQNEGSSALIDFAQQMTTTGSKVVFGAECIADTEAYLP